MINAMQQQMRAMGMRPGMQGGMQQPGMGMQQPAAGMGMQQPAAGMGMQQPAAGMGMQQPAAGMGMQGMSGMQAEEPFPVASGPQFVSIFPAKLHFCPPYGSKSHNVVTVNLTNVAQKTVCFRIRMSDALARFYLVRPAAHSVQSQQTQVIQFEMKDNFKYVDLQAGPARHVFKMTVLYWPTKNENVDDNLWNQLEELQQAELQTLAIESELDHKANLQMCQALGIPTDGQPSPAQQQPTAMPSRQGMGMQQPGMNLQQPGMNMQQPGMNMQQQGMNMQQPGMNMQHPGMNMQQAGIGMQPQGINMQQQGMGMQQPGMNMQQPGMNMQQAGIGMQPQGINMQQQGMGMQQPGMNMQQPGMNMQQAGIGMQPQGINMQQQGMGMQQPGMNMQQPGMNMQQAGIGMQPQGINMQQQGMGMQQAGINMQQQGLAPPTQAPENMDGGPMQATGPELAFIQPTKLFFRPPFGQNSQKIKVKVEVQGIKGIAFKVRTHRLAHDFYSVKPTQGLIAGGKIDTLAFEMCGGKEEKAILSADPKIHKFNLLVVRWPDDNKMFDKDVFARLEANKDELQTINIEVDLGVPKASEGGISVNPSKLQFNKPGGASQFITVTLQNNDPTTLAWKSQGNKGTFYVVKPTKGLLAAGRSEQVSFEMKPNCQAGPGHRFQVLALPAADNQHPPADNWKNPKHTVSIDVVFK